MRSMAVNSFSMTCSAASRSVGRSNASGGLGEDGLALLDDAEVTHLLAGSHLDYLNSRPPRHCGLRD